CLVLTLEAPLEQSPECEHNQGHPPGDVVDEVRQLDEQEVIHPAHFWSGHITAQQQSILPQLLHLRQDVNQREPAEQNLQRHDRYHRQVCPGCPQPSRLHRLLL